MRPAPARRRPGEEQSGRPRNQGVPGPRLHHRPARRVRPRRCQAFYNTSRFTLKELKGRAKQQLRADFEAYLDGFSPNVQYILDNFTFRNQIPTLSKADALGALIEKFLDPEINLAPEPVRYEDGSIKHPALDNHAMGTVFEELVLKFNEDNNEEAVSKRLRQRCRGRCSARLAPTQSVRHRRSNTGRPD